jgi:hypothetical protein
LNSMGLTGLELLRYATVDQDLVVFEIDLRIANHVHEEATGERTEFRLIRTFHVDQRRLVVLEFIPASLNDFCSWIAWNTAFAPPSP